MIGYYITLTYDAEDKTRFVTIFKMPKAQKQMTLQQVGERMENKALSE